MTPRQSQDETANQENNQPRWKTKLREVKGILKSKRNISTRRKTNGKTNSGDDENDSGDDIKQESVPSGEKKGLASSPSLRAKLRRKISKGVDPNGATSSFKTKKTKSIRAFLRKKGAQIKENDDTDVPLTTAGVSAAAKANQAPATVDSKSSKHDDNDSQLRGKIFADDPNDSMRSLQSFEDDSSTKSTRSVRPTLYLKTDPSGRVSRQNSMDTSLSNLQHDSTHSRDSDSLASVRRTSYQSHQAMYHSLAEEELSQLNDLVKSQRQKDWLKQFRRSDPRYQILNFFNDVAQEGADNIERTSFRPEMISPILRAFYKASVFTVWRPTSFDAIRKMMLGKAVGKSLDIKGKSAKKGKLSGFVPFLQIHEEEHKKTIRTLPRDGSIRIFFSSEEGRDKAAETCEHFLTKMLATVKKSKEIMADESEHDEETLEEAMGNMLLDMSDARVQAIDDYAPKTYGIEIPDRLLWEAFVVPADISRPKGSDYETGRSSEPNFQDMNFASLRKPAKEGERRAVILQFSDDDCMCPKNLLMAYEEGGRVLPVVSDFDCFLVGTRGVKYSSPMPNDQKDVLKWAVSQTEAILDDPQSENWTSRWLERLKSEARKGFHPTIPELGFSDPKSYYIMKHAIDRLSTSGAVRHGAESFNYYFPQDLDDQFLVISDNISGQSLPWKYVDVDGLQEILLEKVDDGYTFPLNPKWILCDRGWKNIYNRLLSSPKPNVADSMKIWFPPEVREQIDRVYDKHPNGFNRRARRGRMFREQSRRGRLEDADEPDGTAAMDLAKQELKHYLTLQRAKRKLRMILLIRNLGRKKAPTNISENEEITQLHDNVVDGDQGDTNGGKEVYEDNAPREETKSHINLVEDMQTSNGDDAGDITTERIDCDNGS
mmetsp:Transcript_5317/g.7525  ORF Transcript_5317/g.7525 Transcript_5317/m.7525 type:complete len:885 (-) Transcript_5317:114-2768(-)